MLGFLGSVTQITVRSKGRCPAPGRALGVVGAGVLLAVALVWPAPARGQDAGPAIAIDDDLPLVVDDLPGPEPEPGEAEADAPLDGGAVDSGEGTTFDVELDAGVVTLPPLPEPDAFEAAGEAEPEARPSTKADDDLLAGLPSAAATRQDLPTEQELAQHIEARAAALRAGNLAQADLELALIEELRVALAARNVVVVAAQLIQEAKVAMELGQLDVAARRADAAARLAPDLEAAQWMRARVHYMREADGVPVVVGALRDLLAARMGAFRNQISFLTQLVTMLGLALIASIAMFVVLQLLKYVRYPAHDLAQRVPDFIGGGELTILLFVLVLLPFGLGFGLAPTLALALLVVVGYQQGHERVLGWVLMGVLALGPLLVGLSAPLVSFHGSRVDAMAEATSEAFAEQAEARLRRTGKGREDYASAMVLAHRLRLRGDGEAAAAAYDRAHKAEPTDPVAANNLGVARLALGHNDKAERAFLAAIQHGGGAEPYLNLALLMADRGIFDKSTAYMDKARARDEGLAAQHTLMSGSTSKKAAVAPFDDGLLWERLFAEGQTEAGAITAQLWRPLSGRLPPWATSLVVVLVTLLGWPIVRREHTLSTGCPRCGLPADRFAQAGLCDQCTSVFLSATSVEPSLKAGKERAVRRFALRRRWGGRVLSLVAGAAHLVGGRPTFGLLLFFPFALLVLGLLFGDRAVVHPWFVYVDESAHQAKVIAASVGLAILSLISLRSSLDR